MVMVKNRRRRYLVNFRFQMQFAWLLVVQIAIPTIVFGSFLYLVNKMYLLYLKRIVGEAVVSDVDIQGILAFSIAAIIAFLAISTLLVVFLGIRFSHHVAGPLYKLEKTLDKLARGEKIEPLHFRKTDMIGGLADRFNAVAERLNQIEK